MRPCRLGLSSSLLASWLATLGGCGSAHGGPGETQAGEFSGAANAGGGGGDSSGMLNVQPSPSVDLLGDGGVPKADASGSSIPNSTLSLTIRDFKMYGTDPNANPDFENAVGDDRNIVAKTLGTDGKPVYLNATGTTLTTHGKMYFDQWYNDVAGMNIHVDYPITLSQGAGGTWGYNSAVSGVPLSAGSPKKEFFPIDDGTKYQTLFGNQGEPHNYSFTTELHTVFTYSGNQSFTFTGDDDVFVFINNGLVIDLGGVHVTEQGTINLDTLGLVVGKVYPLDLFNAERHMSESNMSFTTTLNLQPPPPR